MAVSAERVYGEKDCDALSWRGFTKVDDTSVGVFRYGFPPDILESDGCACH